VQRAAILPEEAAETRPVVNKNVMTRTSELTRSSLPDIQKEDLGVESIAGVDVRHYRETQTIPAGEIGNERDLAMSSEFWYAKDLQLNLKAKREPSEIWRGNSYGDGCAAHRAARDV
jgi:hypothetical protein